MKAIESATIRIIIEEHPVRGRLTATVKREGQKEHTYSDTSFHWWKELRGLVQGYPCIATASTGGWTESYLLIDALLIS